MHFDAMHFPKPARIELVLLAFLVPVIFFLAFWNLDGYPTTSGWDEGIYLQFSQTLVDHGKLATQDGSQFHTLIPCGGTGPILTGSVALAMKLLGETLFTARSVMAFYLILSIIGLYLLIREISRWEIAILSTFVYLTIGYNQYDTLWMGRQVLAEIPALVFLFFGLWCLVRVLKQYHFLLFLTSCIFLGLSVVTKNQLLWSVAPSLGLMAFLDLVYLRERRWKIYLIAAVAILIGYATWHVASLMMVGTEKILYQQIQSAMLYATYLRFGLSKTIDNFQLFYHTGFMIPIGLADLFAIIGIVKKTTQHRQTSALFLILSGLGLFCAIFLSLPWARYIYMGIILSVPILAIFLADGISWLRSQRSILIRATATFGLLVFCGFLGYKLVSDGILIVQTQNHDAQVFAEFVDQTVPAGSTILNWEWEVQFFSKSNYINPDFRLFPAMIDDTYNDVEDPILHNQRIPQDVHYMIVGPFANDTEVFETELDHCAFTTLGKVGPYSLLYRK